MPLINEKNSIVGFLIWKLIKDLNLKDGPPTSIGYWCGPNLIFDGRVVQLDKYISSQSNDGLILILLMSVMGHGAAAHPLPAFWFSINGSNSVIHQAQAPVMSFMLSNSPLPPPKVFLPFT
jgi:hypothetical protein